MILHPDEQKALADIDTALGAGEPHLAGMFTIFTRLTDGEGMPPDEDRFKVLRPASELPRRRRSVSGRGLLSQPTQDPRGLRRLTGRPLHFFLIPAALLAVLGLIIYASVTTSARCVTGRPARSSVTADYNPADYSPAGRACPVPRAAAPPTGISGR
jgi:hypothetical protein